MSEALLVLTMFTMYEFTGSVPQELSGMAYDRYQLNEVAKGLEARIPASVKPIGTNVLLVLKTAHEQRIAFTWEF